MRREVGKKRERESMAVIMSTRKKRSKWVMLRWPIFFFFSILRVWNLDYWVGLGYFGEERVITGMYDASVFVASLILLFL